MDQSRCYICYKIECSCSNVHCIRCGFNECDCDDNRTISDVSNGSRNVRNEKEDEFEECNEFSLLKKKRNGLESYMDRVNKRLKEDLEKKVIKVEPKKECQLRFNEYSIHYYFNGKDFSLCEETKFNRCFSTATNKFVIELAVNNNFVNDLMEMVKAIHKIDIEAAELNVGQGNAMYADIVKENSLRRELDKSLKTTGELLYISGELLLELAKIRRVLTSLTDIEPETLEFIQNQYKKQTSLEIQSIDLSYKKNYLSDILKEKMDEPHRRDEGMAYMIDRAERYRIREYGACIICFSFVLEEGQSNYMRSFDCKNSKRFICLTCFNKISAKKCEEKCPRCQKKGHKFEPNIAPVIQSQVEFSYEVLDNQNFLNYKDHRQMIKGQKSFKDGLGMRLGLY